eukprot:g2214.t1
MTTSSNSLKLESTWDIGDFGDSLSLHLSESLNCVEPVDEDLLTDLADIDEILASPIQRPRSRHFSNTTGRLMNPQRGRPLSSHHKIPHKLHDLRPSSTNSRQRPPSSHSITRPTSSRSLNQRRPDSRKSVNRPTSRRSLNSLSRPGSSWSKRPSSSRTIGTVRSLTSLGLRSDSDGEFSSDDSLDPVAPFLAPIIKRLKEGERSPDLICLRIGGRELGDDGAKHLAGAIHGNTNLEQLDLTYNGIGDDGTLALAAALLDGAVTGCMPLFRLSLRHNRFIGDEGAIALASVLESSRTLTDVDISMNRIADAGASAIANALESNKVITSIDLGGNWISDKGAVALAKSLISNKTLRRFQLDGNKISANGLESVKRAVSFHNNTLHTVNLKHNNPKSDGIGGAANLVEAFHRGDKIRSSPLLSRETFIKLTNLRADAANAIPISAAERFRTSNLLKAAEKESLSCAGRLKYRWEEGLLEHETHYGWKGKPVSASGLGRPLFWRAPDLDDLEDEPDEFGRSTIEKQNKKSFFFSHENQ